MSDIRSYSTIAEHADPSQLAGQLNVHRAAMNDAILGENGTVMQFVGDAVMAVFGAPFAQDDHAERSRRSDPHHHRGGQPGQQDGGLLESVSLSPDKLGPLQPFLQPILPFNPGWILLFIGFFCYVLAGRKVGLILCGGNIDPRILASIMVRELEREERIVSFRLTIADRPGVLGPIASLLGELGANILGVDPWERGQ